MEVTFYEDPACSWCWAFQPVATAFAFEFGGVVKPRHVMGGLRDRPAVDIDFIIQQWKKAGAVSGMPFDCGVWKKHSIRTTFLACRAVKAATVVGDEAAMRFLRRLQEAFHVEQTPIDDEEKIFALGGEIGLDAEILRESLSSGRAEALFARDRAEAAQYGFGFPTVVIRNGHQDAPFVLQGAVPYSDLLQALFSMGVSPRQRRRFRESREAWASLFKIHRRLTIAEIQLVTGTPERSKLFTQLEAVGAHREGPFFSRALDPTRESSAREGEAKKTSSPPAL